MSARCATVFTTIAATGLLLSTLGGATPHYIWNASISGPIGLYRVQPATALAVIELVAVQPPDLLAAFLDLNGYLQPTLARSRDCSVTSRLNTLHFASNVRFLGGKLRCLLSARTFGDLHPELQNGTFDRSAYGCFLHRGGSPLTCSYVNHVRTDRNDWKCISSQAAARFWKPAARKLGAGEEQPARAG